MSKKPTVFNDPFDNVTTLTFDIFGTVLDLAGSLVPPANRFLRDHGAKIDGEAFWGQWRARQRIEQYQDNILMLGHSGYLETCKRAFVYCLRTNEVEFTDDEVTDFMAVYQYLDPYQDAIEGLNMLAARFKLVALSNGEQPYLEHLVARRIGIDFDAVISVQHVGVFKPHPAVYRTAAGMLNSEPGELMMVAAHAFDILGARACGYRGAYVNRYGLPAEVRAYPPDIEVRDFIELSDRLLGA
jgi:2-haloacid dehalogenase